MSEHGSYASPLSGRYASPSMLALWSAERRYGLWRRLWLALAEAEKSLGVPIPDEAIAQMRDHLDDIDFGAVAAYEKRFRHDVMAHVHAFGDVAPAARGFIHYGATSCFVTDNAELILMREGMKILRAKVIDVVRALRDFALTWREQPTLGYTHLQPAQLTTVGKRATLWIQDLLLDAADLERRIEDLPFRGVKGTTGTQASFLEILAGDHGKVRELDELVTRAMGFTRSLLVTGQTYTRKLDAQVLGALAGVAASAAKFASDMRLLQAFGEIEEPFEKDQIGSSAMAYKRNPMRSERINSLARFVASLEQNANQTHSVQYFERTLDDSANRRLVIPEMFLATDALVVLLLNVSNGLEVHPARIAARIEDELPFMATEELMVRAVRAGMSRQDAHELIRQHSIAAARAMKDEGSRNDLLDRLARDARFQVPLDDMKDALKAERFTGRAARQVTEFVAEAVDPLLDREPAPGNPDEVRV